MDPAEYKYVLVITPGFLISLVAFMFSPIFLKISTAKIIPPISSICSVVFENLYFSGHY